MGNGTNGILGKFQQRIKNIRLARFKNKKRNEEFVKEKVDEIHRLVDGEPRLYPRGISDSEQNSNQRKHVGVLEQNGETKKKNEDNDNFVQNVVDEIHRVVDERPRVYPRGISDRVQNDNQQQIREQNDEVGKKIGASNVQNEDADNKKVEQEHDVSKDVDDVHRVNTFGDDNSIKEDKNNSNGYVFDQVKMKVSVNDDEERKKRIKDIGEDLLFRINEEFEECIDELDVLEGELYLLSSEEELALTVNKIKKIKNRINEAIEKYNELVAVYNSYKKKFFIDSVDEINDNVIADDLISFRMLLDDSADKKKFVGEVGHLESFQFLYSRLNEVKSEVEQLKEKTNVKQVKFEERDKKYKEILSGSLNAIQINKDCVEEINKQNEYFDSLMSKVNDINTNEYVTVHLRGLNELIFSSLRYAGLMLLSPLRNTVPGIGAQMVATRMLVHNLYNNLHYEEVRHIHHDAVDYDQEINNNLTDVRYVSGVIDDTLKDVERLRDDFMMIYDSKVPGYDDTLNRINNLYNVIKKNQRKINIAEKNLNSAKRMNEDKLTLVRRLNENE